MGRKSKSRGVTVDGPWLPLPIEFLASKAFAQLSALAVKMLFLLVAQLRANAYGNGRLDAHFDSRLKPNGWNSHATAQAALHELIDAGIVVVTRQGHRGCIGLYAVTIWEMHCDPKGLDVGPGAWRRTDWQQDGALAAPATRDQPAVWNRPRANGKHERRPRGGGASRDYSPAAGEQSGSHRDCAPATGVQTAVVESIALPPRGLPLRVAICTRQRSGALAASSVGGSAERDALGTETPRDLTTRQALEIAA